MRTKNKKPLEEMFIAKENIPKMDEEVRRKLILESYVRYINEMELLENPDSDIRYRLKNV